MNTLYDFITHVKGVEYLLSVMFIAGYILYAEVLKPKPFKTMIEAGRDDAAYIKKGGFKNTLRTLSKVAAAPFIGLAYVVILPFAFFFTLGAAAFSGVMSLAGRSVSFGWRPTEAYLAGKKKKKENKEDEGK